MKHQIMAIFRFLEISLLIALLFWPTLDADLLPEETQENVYDLSNNDHSKVKSEGSPGGAIYTRWGSSSCKDGSQLVYSGTPGGSRWSNSGGGSNYLCMPYEPIYEEFTPEPTTYAAYLYSTEYATANGPKSLQDVHDHAPTCAVCRAPPDRMTKLMIPARNVCPPGDWRLEYKGYLMAERHSHYRTEFVCMDENMDVEPGTEGSQSPCDFFFVQVICQEGGGIPCGPYANGREITCAVCTI